MFKEPPETSSPRGVCEALPSGEQIPNAQHSFRVPRGVFKRRHAQASLRALRRCRRGLPSRDQQLDGEDAAFAGHVLDVDLAAISAHALAADGEAKAEAGIVGAAPLERTEPLLRLAGPQAATLAVNFDKDAIRLFDEDAIRL